MPQRRHDLDRSSGLSARRAARGSCRRGLAPLVDASSNSCPLPCRRRRAGWTLSRSVVSRVVFRRASRPVTSALGPSQSAHAASILRFEIGVMIHPLRVDDVIRCSRDPTSRLHRGRILTPRRGGRRRDGSALDESGRGLCVYARLELASARVWPRVSTAMDETTPAAHLPIPSSVSSAPCSGFVIHQVAAYSASIPEGSNSKLKP